MLLPLNLSYMVRYEVQHVRRVVRLVPRHTEVSLTGHGSEELEAREPAHSVVAAEGQVVISHAVDGAHSNRRIPACNIGKEIFSYSTTPTTYF